MKFVLTLLLLFTSAFAAVREVSPPIEPVPGGISGSGMTTHYWDCCKPACAWHIDDTHEKIAVQSCEIDGVTPIDDNSQSGCDADGVAYTCSNQQAWVVNSTLAYGFTAASFTGGVDNSKCCRCVLLSFQGQLKGKQLLAQITNTGGDLNENHFDIQIPGGGVGLFTRGCHTQWNTPEDGWGDRYGGIHTEAECSLLPEVLQPGCKFRFGFMEGVENPNVTFVQVKCPTELSELTLCEPDSDI